MTRSDEGGSYFGVAVKWTVTTVASVFTVGAAVLGVLGALPDTAWLHAKVPRSEILVSVIVSAMIFLIVAVFTWVDQTRLRKHLRRALNGEAALAEAVSLLEDIRYFDPTTGIPNSAALERDLAPGGRMSGGGSRCLIKLDLEDFGRINKEAGHWAGDEYLRRFAAAVYRATRRDEAFYRRSQGADEFYILLRGDILSGLGYLTRLDERAGEFDDMARALGARYRFSFRAALIPLSPGEDLAHAEKRLDPLFVRVSANNRRYRVDWAKRADDTATPDGFDEAEARLQGKNALLFDAARRRFRTSSSRGRR